MPPLPQRVPLAGKGEPRRAGLAGSAAGGALRVPCARGSADFVQII